MSKCVPQEAFRDLEKALKNWRAGRSRFPRFKRKKLSPDNTARLTGSIRVFPRHIQLPRVGRVRSKEATEKLLRLLEGGKARILSATLSREADRFYVSLTCEVERLEPERREVRREEDVVGIDLGLQSFAVLSDGTRIEAPRPLARKLRLLKRRSKQFSRKEKGSSNSRKAALRLARLHRKVRNARNDFLHKLTTELAKTKPVLVIEDLSVKGLVRGNLSRSVADVGWGAFRRMLGYKAGWYGATLIVAPKNLPSTRLCSRCGHLHGKMPLSQRTFWCGACGLEMNRDLNAALNLRAYGLAHLTGSTASSAGSYARGDPHGSWKREVARHHRPLEG